MTPPATAALLHPTVERILLDRFLQLFRVLSVKRGKVTLVSGKESDLYFDCKQTVLTAEGHALVGEVLFALLCDRSRLPACDAVAGVELGGCPLASAVSLVSYQRGWPLPALYVRKERKDHGTGKLVEGEVRVGLQRVILLEDVVTTGGSSLRAVAALTAAGAHVVGVAALVDREEGGADAIRAAGLAFVALARQSDFRLEEVPDG